MTHTRHLTLHRGSNARNDNAWLAQNLAQTFPDEYRTSSTHGTPRTKTVAAAGLLPGTGYLDPAFHQSLRRSTFIVYSYGTPIAWQCPTDFHPVAPRGPMHAAWPFPITLTEHPAFAVYVPATRHNGYGSNPLSATTLRVWIMPARTYSATTQRHHAQVRFALSRQHNQLIPGDVRPMPLPTLDAPGDPTYQDFPREITRVDWLGNITPIRRRTRTTPSVNA